MTAAYPHATQLRADPHRLLVLALLSLLFGSCAEHLQIRVDSAPNVNELRSVYVIVRSVQEADYAGESYDEIAARVVHPDDSVQGAAAALPGVPLSFSVAAPPKKTRIAVYALFERPRCGAWRVLLPVDARAVNVRLNDGQLCLVGEAGVCTPAPCMR